MRLAARRRVAWSFGTQSMEGCRSQARVGSEWLDVVRVGAGEPLVLVPGLAGGWRLLAPLAERLSRRFEVHLCGLRGDRGAFAGPTARSMSDHAADLAETIRLLGLERPTVLGVSYGGAVALSMALEHPSAAGALALFGVEARFRSSIGSTIARRALERFPIPSDNRFVNQFFNLLHGGRPESADFADFVVERCWETDQAVMARRLALLESFDVRERLWEIDVPTLVIAGTRDVVTPLARQQALAHAIPGASFEQLEGAGHIGFLTHRSEIAQRLAGLVTRVGQSAF